MSRIRLTAEARAEYKALLEAAFNAADTTTERVDAMERLLAEKVRDGKGWARIVERDALREGLRVEVVNHGKSRQPRVCLAYNGRLISKSRRRGVTRRDDDGAPVYQQNLWEDMSWDDFDSVMKSRIGQVRTLSDEVLMMRRLGELRELWPESERVADALRSQGVSLDEWLAAS